MTTSPLIAKFVHQNFEGIEVRASVNTEIGTVQGMDYLAEYFDSYYMKRELNRDFEAIASLHQWAQDNGKQLFLLANSGCLNHCSAHVFHDNLVAHEAQIAKMDNAYAFGGICHEYLKDPMHYRSLIEDTNFIRPEDIHKYEPYFTAAKLATRIHPNPTSVVNSYIRGKFICGRACDMACYVHLEEKGVLTKKFKTPFRKREEWQFSLEDFKK